MMTVTWMLVLWSIVLAAVVVVQVIGLFLWAGLAFCAWVLFPPDRPEHR